MKPRSSRFPLRPVGTALLMAALAAWSWAWPGPPRADARKLTVEKPDRTVQEDPQTGRSALRSAPGGVPYQYRRFPLELGEPSRSADLDRRVSRRAEQARGGGALEIWRVAAIRIEFREDRKGDQTTGDGRMLRQNPDPDIYFIDPAPHDEAYFLAHLEALDRYWASMTYGRLRVEGDVFPRNNDFGSYELSDMADYGPQNDDELFSITGLTNYSRESLIAADADSDLVWSDYDALFVMHAGSDWQNDVLQNSPFDLPTFSIVFSDSDVVVTDTGDTLTTMITFPETSSQDGFLVALNGAIAHEFGHQLNLFDLYNVETFAPTVGYYDLMDSGNLTTVVIPHPTTGEEREVVGVLPTALGAWSRWFVTGIYGIEPKLIKGDAPRYKLKPVQSRQENFPSRQDKWFHLPLSESEYFLVENRVDDLDGIADDGGFNTALDQDDSTGVVLGPVVRVNPQGVPADSTIISHNYDLLLDPGVLIWHIDERQAVANLSAGRGLNVFYEKRSITIEEADGIIDIGSPYSFFPLGTDKETFHADNNANFSGSTRPSSDSNLGPPSNISVLDIGPRGETVPMDILFSSKPRGWPMEIGPFGFFGLTSVLADDVDNDGQTDISVMADSTAFLFRYEDENDDGDVDFVAGWPTPTDSARVFGTPIFNQVLADLDGDDLLETIAVTDSGAIHVWDFAGQGYGIADTTGLFLTFPSSSHPAGWPVPADLDRNGADELYVTTQDGFLVAYDLAAGSPDTLWTKTLADSADSISAQVAIGDLNGDTRLDGIVGFVHRDSLLVRTFTEDGAQTLRTGWVLPQDNQTQQVWIGLADLDRKDGTNDLEVVLTTNDGEVYVSDRFGRLLDGWPRTVNRLVGGPVAFGDLDDDGLLEIVMTSGPSTIHAFNYNGTEMAGWPVNVELADHPAVGNLAPPGPVVADVDGDGRLDAVAGFRDFTVRALDPTGEEVGGFPIVTGGPILGSPAILDANGDERLDLFVYSVDGHVYGRILSGFASRTNPAWGMIGNGSRLHGSFDPARMPLARTGNDAVLEGPVRIYPNPVTKADGQITIRYALGPDLQGATAVDISTYNLAGEIVAELQGTVFPNTENVVSIPVDQLASGVYFCTIRARSGGRLETQQQKFAVIR